MGAPQARQRPARTTKLATGMRYVLVNGSFAVDDGQPTGALEGKVLAKPRPISEQ